MSADKVAATFHGQADLPFGTPVTYWPGVREGAGIESVTRSATWMVCGQPVVLVEGYSGGIALTHIERRPRPVEELVGVLTDPDWDKDREREQELCAHIADLLTDVDHFAGCTAEQGMTNCVCLVGRLHWAIGADEVPA